MIRTFTCSDAECEMYITARISRVVFIVVLFFPSPFIFINSDIEFRLLYRTFENK